MRENRATDMDTKRQQNKEHNTKKSEDNKRSVKERGLLEIRGKNDKQDQKEQVCYELRE